MPSHNHGVNDPGHSHYLAWLNNINVANFSGAYGSVGSNTAGYTNAAVTGISIQNAGSNAAFSLLQPSRAALLVIKT